MAADATASIAMAQGKLDARYNVTLGGVPFGRGAWVIDVKEDHFTSAVSGATSGLLQLFSKGRGTSAARGNVAAGGQLTATSYSSSIETEKKYDEVRMVMNAGTVKEFIAEPPNTPDPRRVPVKEQHRRGVLDPMTASIVRVPGNGNTFVPQACDRKLAVFDGRMRYDLQLVYKRLDRVKSEKGYQGNVVVCTVLFFAGGRPRPGPCSAQIHAEAARHRDVVGAHRRHAPDGAVPGFGDDPAGAGAVAGRAVRHRTAVRARHLDRRQTATMIGRPRDDGGRRMLMTGRLGKESVRKNFTRSCGNFPGRYDMWQ